MPTYPISENILKAASGNEDSYNIVRDKIISYAKDFIQEEKLDEIETVTYEQLIKCGIYGMEKHFEDLRTTNIDSHANYIGLNRAALREMISFIKLSTRKNKQPFERYVNEIFPKISIES